MIATRYTDSSDARKVVLGHVTGADVGVWRRDHQARRRRRSPRIPRGGIAGRVPRGAGRRPTVVRYGWRSRVAAGAAAAGERERT